VRALEEQAQLALRMANPLFLILFEERERPP
jgi:hypothetical protein